MRRESDFFGDKELALIYMARRLKRALAAEKLFEERGVDYFLETAPYQSGLLFPTARMGVLFYVAAEDEERARALLLESGHKPYDSGHHRSEH
jgi:hypothetical protein